VLTLPRNEWVDGGRLKTVIDGRRSLPQYSQRFLSLGYEWKQGPLLLLSALARMAFEVIHRHEGVAADLTPAIGAFLFETVIVVALVAFCKDARSFRGHEECAWICITCHNLILERSGSRFFFYY
jgi:hypothetical protein